MPTSPINNTTPTKNTTMNGDNDVAISSALPARWGYLYMDTDCDQPARPRDRVKRDLRLHEKFIACLIALPVAILALVAVCVAAVMSADHPVDYYGPEERMRLEEGR